MGVTRQRGHRSAGVAVLVCVAVLSVGCSAIWIKTGGTEAEMRRDAEECRQKAAAAPRTPPLATVAASSPGEYYVMTDAAPVAEDMRESVVILERCLAAKGYERK